jgi:hypothetical protein
MSEYEFTAEQNNSIDGFSQKLLHICILLIGIGATLLVFAHRVATDIDLWHMTFGAMAFMVLGFVYFRPLDNFKRITTTKGHDVFELMIAMDDLRIAYLTGGVLMVFMIGLLSAEIIWR